MCSDNKYRSALPFPFFTAMIAATSPVLCNECVNSSLAPPKTHTHAIFLTWVDCYDDVHLSQTNRLSINLITYFNYSKILPKITL